MNKLLSYIGVYAPIILFVSSLFLLYDMKHIYDITNYFFPLYFVVGFIINNIINILLKITIKEKRPLNDDKRIELGIVNGHRTFFDKFGMPSGHAQNCAYILTFITLALRNFMIFNIYLLIIIISLIQRYLYNNHSILQLFVGLCIGILVAYISYKYGIILTLIILN